MSKVTETKISSYFRLFNQVAEHGMKNLVRDWTVSESLQFCENLAHSHYENFTVGSFFLPKNLHPYFCSIYAFCRWSDDLGDELKDPRKSLERLIEWDESLRSLTLSHRHHPILAAIHETIQKFSLPLEPFCHLIRAFKQDQSKTRYSSYSELLEYCQFSANPVGRLVLMLFGYRDEKLFSLSDKTCTALQLTNFWQDVFIDLRKGRIYIPQDDMKSFDYNETLLTQGRENENFFRLMKFQCDRTGSLFEEGLRLVSLIRGRLKLDVELFSRGGMAILKAIEKQEFHVLDKRPALSFLDKQGLILSVFFRYLTRRFHS